MSKLKENLVAYKIPILYTGSSIVKALAGIIVSFIIARYVSPEDLGLWTTISLALTYSVFLQGGVINGLNLELPYAYGKGNKEEAEKLAAVSQTYIIAVSILVLSIGVGINFFYPFQEAKVKWGVLAITFMICFTFYQSYLLSTFRSNDAFLKLSYIQFVDAIVNIGTLILIIYYAYYGMIVKATVVIFIYVILLHIFRPIKVRFYWNKNIFKNLLKVGFPIFGLAYLELITSTIDKVWIIKFSDLNNVGLYSFGLYSLTMVTLFSSSIASYIYPRMTYNYGANNNKVLLWKYVKKVTNIVFITLLPVVVIGYFALPYIIQTFFPNYILSTKVMQILLIAGLFKGAVIGVNVLWSMKKWKYMIIYQLSYSLLYAGFTYLFFILLNKTIEGIAIGVLLANVSSVILGLLLSFIGTHK